MTNRAIAANIANLSGRGISMHLMELTREPSLNRETGARGKNEFFIDGPAGGMQAILSQPSGNLRRQAVGIVCHPHPLYDGSMHNKVTYSIARSFNDLGLPAIRFNFRGVDQSEGEFAEGIGETDDLLAVIAYVEDNFPGHEIWVAGFSFGAYIALRAGNLARIDRLITIAPPVNFFDFSEIHTPKCPWLVIQGDNDEIVPSQAVLDWLDELESNHELAYMEGVGHFFHRRLNDLREKIESHAGSAAARLAICA